MVKHYVGEAGSSLILDTGILIGSADFGRIKYRKPDGITTGTFVASLYSSYSQLAEATGTYFLSYTVTSSDFDQPGEWRFHSLVGAVDGTWQGELAKLNIFDNFE